MGGWLLVGEVGKWGLGRGGGGITRKWGTGLDMILGCKGCEGWDFERG